MWDTFTSTKSWLPKKLIQIIILYQQTNFFPPENPPGLCLALSTRSSLDLDGWNLHAPEKDAKQESPHMIFIQGMEMSKCRSWRQTVTVQIIWCFFFKTGCFLLLPEMFGNVPTQNQIIFDLKTYWNKKLQQKIILKKNTVDFRHTPLFFPHDLFRVGPHAWWEYHRSQRAPFERGVNSR